MERMELGAWIWLEPGYGSNLRGSGISRRVKEIYHSKT